MKATEAVRKKVDSRCVAKGCKRGRCSVSMGGISKRALVIDVDNKYSPAEKDSSRCDFLVVIDSADNDDQEWAAAIELKAGKVGASEAKKQLQSGADLANNIVPINSKIRFIPVVASGSMDKYEIGELRKKTNQVRFRGDDLTIERIRCGYQLAGLLKG